MLNAKKLLQYEYFPEELPECFTSKGLADNYEALKGQAESNSKPSSPLLFSIYKGVNSRRRMAIPNPLSYMRIVTRLVDNRDEIKTLFDKSKISLTKPSDNQCDTEKRAYNRISNSQTETRLANERLFSNNSVCVKMDISNFFDSVYTHSVSWAIHTKEVAKARKDDKNALGNKIDNALQGLNDRQTHGILVGNAVSRLVSEIILCDIDKEITARFPKVNVCRFVDDYSFYISDKESTNAIISFVRNQLLKYDLVLNESKTRIIQAPFLLERSGIDEIKSIATDDAYTYYNRMMILFDKYKDLSLLKYGFSVIAMIINASDFKQMFPLLVHAWVTFPSLAYKILPILYKFKDMLSHNEKDGLKRALSSVALNGIELRQEVETVWALWAMTLFGFPINKEIVTCVCNSNNDLAIIISLTHIKDKGYKYYNRVVSELVERIKEESAAPIGDNRSEIFFSHWLLIYELVKKHIVTLSDFPCVNDIKFYRELIRFGVDFYDESIVPDSTYVASKNQSDDSMRYEIITLLRELVNETSDSNKTALTNAIDRIIRGNNAKWTYE